MIMIVPKIACLAPLVSTNCKAIKEYMMILGFVFFSLAKYMLIPKSVFIPTTW